MNAKHTDSIMHNSVFAKIALGTAALMLTPLLAMQVSSEVNWSISDFVIMGTLIFGTASVFVLAARKIAKKHRVVAGVLCLLAFLWLWAELAVGVFTSWGS